MVNINDLKKSELQNILNSILKSHNELIRHIEGKWWVEDSDFGLEVKSTLIVYGLIEEETIND